MKKTFALILVAVMLLSLGMTAFAEEETTSDPVTGTSTDKGSITISNAVIGETYDIYQLLVLESYDSTASAYVYTATDTWENWLKATAQQKYVTFDTNGYVTWVKDADAAEFAKAVIAYAKAAEITPDKTIKATSTTVKFDDLSLGYYAVDTTLGTLCALKTTDRNVTITEKNTVPTIDKYVKEDSKTGDNAWGKTNDADIGDTVEFKTIVKAYEGAENYVVHDQMSAGLTFNRGSIEIKVGETPLVEGTDYTVKHSFVHSTSQTGQGGTLIIPQNVCDFEIHFTKAFLDTIKNGTGNTPTDIVITYTATVNENAVIALPGNPNKTWLDYGEKTDTTDTRYTEPSETVTYTWDLDVLKYANGVETAVLKDAQFVLLNSTSDKVATFENGKLKSWIALPAEGQTWDAASVLTTGADGKICIDGLDADTYHLREIKAPAGYNKLSSDIEAKVEAATTGEDNQLTYTTKVVKVNNQSGTKLPETGSTGTTLFITLGSIVALIAVVFMITRKKMSVYED